MVVWKKLGVEVGSMIIAIGAQAMTHAKNVQAPAKHMMHTI
jgi:hypothetical protein